MESIKLSVRSCFQTVRVRVVVGKAEEMGQAEQGQKMGCNEVENLFTRQAE